MIYELFRDYFSSEEKFLKFADWAFGIDWPDIRTGPQLIQCWNDVHYWEYRLSHYGDLSKDAEIIYELWKNKK